MTDHKELYRRMKNVAAGYSNHCDESGSTRRLDKEFEEIDQEARAHQELPEHTAAERKDFERECEAMGFDLQRMDCPAPEPWSEYADEATGHRWGGWLAGVEWAWSRNGIAPHQPQPEGESAEDEELNNYEFAKTLSEYAIAAHHKQTGKLQVLTEILVAMYQAKGSK